MKPKLLTSIYEEFLQEDAVMEINVKKNLIGEIEIILEEENPNIDEYTLTEIQKEISHSIIDTFLRFLESSEYEEYKKPTLQLNQKKSKKKSFCQMLQNVFNVKASPKGIQNECKAIFGQKS